MPEPIVTAIAHTIGTSSAAAQVCFALASLFLIRTLTKFTLCENWTFKNSTTYNLFSTIRTSANTFAAIFLQTDLRVAFIQPSKA